MYAVDKRLRIEELGNERIDVIVGAVLTGVIGLFIVIASAATLHERGASITDASDAARALEPLAGNLAATLFGLVGAALLAAAIVPLSTAYSVSQAFAAPAASTTPEAGAALLRQLRLDGRCRCGARRATQPRWGRTSSIAPAGR